MRIFKVLVIFLWSGALWANTEQALQASTDEVRSVVAQTLLQAFDDESKVEITGLEVRPVLEEGEQLADPQGSFFTSGYGIFKKWYVGGEMLVPIDDAQWQMRWPGLAPNARWQGNIEVERQLGVSAFIGRSLFVGLRIEGEFILNNQKGPGFSELEFVSPNEEEQRLLGRFVTAEAGIRSIQKSQMFLNLYYDFKRLRESNWTPYVGLGVGRDSTSLKDVTNKWNVGSYGLNVDPVVRRAFDGADRHDVVTSSPSRKSVNYQALVGVDYALPKMNRLSVGVKGRYTKQRPGVVGLGGLSLTRRTSHWQVGANLKILLGPMD